MRGSEDFIILVIPFEKECKIEERTILWDERINHNYQRNEADKQNPEPLVPRNSSWFQGDFTDSPQKTGWSLPSCD